MFAHGITFGGHPVQCAIALEEPRDHEARARSSSTSPSDEDDFRADARASCSTCRSSATSAATGYFFAIELVRDKDTRTSFSDEESETLLRGFLSPRLLEAGLICRADDRGDPVIQLSPPLIAGQEQFDEIAGILGTVLEEAWAHHTRA